MDTNRSAGRLAELTPYDCWALLEDAEIGRVAWSGPDGPAIIPVNLTVADGSVWFRTAPYAPLVEHCRRSGRVAVEVDHLEPERKAGWSVVVTGTAEVVDGDDVPETVHLLDTWAPGTRTAHVRVNAGLLTGRRVVPPTA